jgi:hypothetical protein
MVSQGCLQFVGGDLYNSYEDSHSLVVFVCSTGASRCLEVRYARLASRGVPGDCCYLGVPVLVVSFPYMLALLHVPYSYWVGILIYWIVYQNRIVK